MTHEMPQAVLSSLTRLICALLLAAPFVAEARQKTLPVLCLASEDCRSQGLDSLDQTAVEAYRDMGFDLTFGYYQRQTRESLRGYAAVVGMIPQLHAGTRAIDAALGAALTDYVAQGGGFLLIPGPSYYTGQDFVRQLNPWLAQFGATLLAEQPRDPQNEIICRRVLDYRYLKAKPACRHEVTRWVRNVWLPLDYSDSFLRTHSMSLSPEWTVLLEGSETCSTRAYPVKEGPTAVGTYPSSPPFLAVREWGAGRIGIFSTASRYFIYDAFHWAHGDGLVLEKGQGMRLMRNLLRYLADRRIAPQRSEVGAGTASTDGVPRVPVSPDRDAWLKVVQSELAPPGFGVTHYVDCGGVTDVPYTLARGRGYVDTPATNWLIRWPSAEMFHVTGANARAFDRKTLQYRFDGLAPEVHQYRLGILAWGFQPEGARSFSVAAAGMQLADEVTLPRFADECGPAFRVVDVPADAVKDGSLLLDLSVTDGGSGTFSSVSEIWVFEAGRQAITPADIRARFQSPSMPADELLFSRHVYHGLIGARSPYTDGTDSVAALSAAAKEEGLSFLVFTDDAKALTPTSFARLRADCAAASSDAFQAIPGATIADRYRDLVENPTDPRTWGDVRACVFEGLTALPAATDYGNPYSFFWKFFGGELSGGHRCAPTLLQPGTNRISPFFQRFWRGFNVLTLGEHGGVIDDSRELYRDMVGGGYGPFPRVSGIYRSAAEIRAAADGWRVCITAPKPKDILPCNYTSAVTNGPEVKLFAFSSDFCRDGRSGEGVLIREPTWLHLRCVVESEAPIRTVTLFDGVRVERRWYPGTPRFEVREPLLAVGRKELWLHVQTEDDREAITGRFLVQDHTFPLGMCADNQNTICNLFRTPTRFVRDERELYAPHSYWHTGEAGGQLGVMRASEQLVPRVIEQGIIQAIKHFRPCPLVRLADGTVEDHTHAQMRIGDASGDANQVEYRYDTPGSKTRSRTLLTSFRSSLGGGTAVLIESVLEAKTDVSLAPHGAGLRLLSIAMMPTLPPAWDYAFETPDGRREKGVFAELGAGGRRDGLLSSEGGVMLWPSEVGNLLVFPLEGDGFTVTLENLLGRSRGREFVRIGRQTTELAEGDVIRTRLLVILHAGAVSSARDLQRLRTQYCTQASVVTELETGTLVGRDYPVAIQADGGGVAARIRPSPDHDPTPLEIRGLEANWSCLDVCDDAIRVMGAAPDGLRLVVGARARAGERFIGHPVVCDSPDIKIEWGGLCDAGVRLHLHNPTRDTVRTTLRSHPAFPVPLALNAVCELAPGQSVWLCGRGEELQRERVGETAP